MIKTQTLIRNVNILKAGDGEKQRSFSYGAHFIDLEPTHYTLLQKLTYEALIADREKIV